jgi:hypothetical protein
MSDKSGPTQDVQDADRRYYDHPMGYNLKMGNLSQQISSVPFSDGPSNKDTVPNPTHQRSMWCNSGRPWWGDHAFILDDTNGTTTVAIGTTTTLAAGSPATVTNTGTSTNLILNFGVPQGTAGTNGTNGTNGTSAAPTASGTCQSVWISPAEIAGNNGPVITYSKTGTVVHLFIPATTVSTTSTPTSLVLNPQFPTIGGSNTALYPLSTSTWPMDFESDGVVDTGLIGNVQIPGYSGGGNISFIRDTDASPTNFSGASGWTRGLNYTYMNNLST